MEARNRYESGDIWKDVTGMNPATKIVFSFAQKPFACFTRKPGDVERAEWVQPIGFFSYNHSVKPLSKAPRTHFCWFAQKPFACFTFFFLSPQRPTATPGEPRLAHRLLALGVSYASILAGSTRACTVAMRVACHVATSSTCVTPTCCFPSTAVPDGSAGSRHPA